MKLEIVIDLEHHIKPTSAELEQSGYAYELDYWLDLIYADPPLMLDGATVRLTPVDGCAGQVAPNSEVERGAAATEHHC